MLKNKRTPNFSRMLVVLICIMYMTTIAAQETINTCGDAYWGCIGFDSTADTMDNYIAFDTAQIDNVWQYGHSEKAIAYMVPEARIIITDSLNSYPNNNISSFEMVFHCKFEDNCGSFNCWSVYINYTCDTQGGVDGFMIEISFDDSTFTNIANLTEIFEIYQNMPFDTVSSLNQLGFSGNSTDQLEFHYCYGNVDFDTLLNPITFRFTFASDSTDTGQEGVAISSIGSFSGFLSVEETQIENLFKLYPNPAFAEVVVDLIEINSNSAVSSIYNIMGNLVQTDILSERRNTISLENLTAGVYYIRVATDDRFQIKRMIKL